jgi:hypothetical protein
VRFDARIHARSGVDFGARNARISAAFRHILRAHSGSFSASKTTLKTTSKSAVLERVFGVFFDVFSRRASNSARSKSFPAARNGL